MTAARMRTFKQQDMDEFGVASGSTGLIHTEPEFAAATPFGATLVQGVYLLAVLERQLCDRVSEWAVCGGLEVKFISPVTEGAAFSVGIIENGPRSWLLQGSTPAGPAVIGLAWLRPDPRVGPRLGAIADSGHQ
jgi:hypothetical protein